LTCGYASSQSVRAGCREEFFKRFQTYARDWVEPGVTKTSLVYNMGRKVITNRE
jgi:hypothetical protein